MLKTHETESFMLAPMERFAFFAKASSADAIVARGERRLYGCFILAKGVIAPEA